MLWKCIARWWPCSIPFAYIMFSFIPDTPGPCPPGHIFRIPDDVQETTGSTLQLLPRGQCQCKEGYVPWSDGICYRLYTRGPCGSNEFLVNGTSCVRKLGAGLRGSPKFKEDDMKSKGKPRPKDMWKACPNPWIRSASTTGSVRCPAGRGGIPTRGSCLRVPFRP